MSQIDGPAISSAAPQPERVSSDNRAWLEQAAKVREKVFRLAYVVKDGEASPRPVGTQEPTSATLRAQAPNKAMMEYLAESEKLFDLTLKLAESGEAEWVSTDS